MDDSLPAPDHSPDHLAHVGGDEVSDELLHVIVDRSALLHGRHDGGEVVVCQHHLRGRLGHGSAGAHGNANLRLLQGRGVVDTVTSLEKTQVVKKRERSPPASCSRPW